MNRDLEKALKDYDELYGRPTPVRYDVLHFSDDHRRMDALMRRHYDKFHPLVKDIFTSFTLEFTLLLEKVETIEEELEQLREETAEKQRVLDEELDERLQNLRTKEKSLEQQLKAKDREIEKLNKIIEEQGQKIKEKEALIITQRRQLDLYIEQTTIMESKQEEHTEQVAKSIAHVSEFSDQLLELENSMKQLEQEKADLQDQNRALRDQLHNNEDQYVKEIEEISELYNSLTSKTTGMVSRIEKLQEERDKYAKQSEEISRQYDELIENMNLQQNDREQVKHELKMLRNELDRKNSQLSELREKNEQFKMLAARILKLKEKVFPENGEPSEKTEKKPVEAKIFHPAKEAKQIRKWQPKKTALEEEIEQEQGPRSKISSVSLIEKDAELGDSVAKITSKLSMLQNENDLVSSIKQSIRDSPANNNFLNTVDKKLEKVEEEIETSFKITEVDAETNTPNLERLMGKLRSDDMEALSIFSSDFPAPPQKEDTKADKSKKGRSDKDTEETQSTAI